LWWLELLETSKVPFMLLADQTTTKVGRIQILNLFATYRLPLNSLLLLASNFLGVAT
jgi:hypothetical protein